MLDDIVKWYDLIQ